MNPRLLTGTGSQEDPWRRKWQPTPVLLPGKSHRQRSLTGYSPWSHKESDTTEQLYSLDLLSYAAEVLKITVITNIMPILIHHVHDKYQ